MPEEPEVKLLAALLLVFAIVSPVAARTSGLTPSSQSDGGPGYYIRADDPILGPCHVTDDYAYDSWAGALAPGESFSVSRWFCGPLDASVLPGYLDEQSDEDYGFDLTGRGELAATLTLLTPDLGTQAIAVRVVPDRTSHLHGCVFAAQRERYDATNTVYFQRGYVTLTVTNTGRQTARNVALAVNLDLEGSPKIVPYC